jgi:hypothetical protein
MLIDCHNSECIIVLLTLIAGTWTWSKDSYTPRHNMLYVKTHIEQRDFSYRNLQSIAFLQIRVFYHLTHCDIVKSLNLEPKSSLKSLVFESKSQSFILESRVTSQVPSPYCYSPNPSPLYLSHGSSHKSLVLESKFQSFILESRVKSQVPW